MTPGVDLDELRVVAQTALEREPHSKDWRPVWRIACRDMKMRKRNLEAASNNDRAWQKAWLDACSKCWLGEGGLRLSVATVRETLSALAELGPATRTTGRR